MQIRQNVPLADYSTMGLGGPAAHLTEITSPDELTKSLDWAHQHNLSVIMIGDGSNIVWRDQGFEGLVLVNRIMGYEAFDEDETNTYLTIGAGEKWDHVVERSVSAGLTGIEALSMIPGTAGATPIQNVGAYGQEIAQTLTSLEAYDLEAGKFVNIPANQCGFSYRMSRFKSADRGRFFITRLTLHLTKGNPLPPFYGALQSYLDDHDIGDYTPAAIRQAVMAIRAVKLPDPSVVRNNGSFFANPIVTAERYKTLAQQFAGLPHWETAQGDVKLSAAWLIEQAGFADHHDSETGMATWQNHPLVMVNEHARTTADLLKFRQKITDAVQSRFGVDLDQEPELLP